jgi:phosphoribosylglycinamide formyltransferase-1
MTKIKVAVLISGRGSNLQALVKACRSENFPAQISLVISNKSDAPGLTFAKENNIKTLFINNKSFKTREDFDNQMHSQITNNNCELICLAGFMRILSTSFVEQWQGKMINIHPSLLPLFKGANAVQDALDANTTESGCTTHYVNKEVDSGQIITQEVVPILKNDTLETLAGRILQKEHLTYPKALQILCKKLINKQ